jgi:O-acetyl-ADP-ribose deacetylase (regulator of RNase III)
MPFTAISGDLITQEVDAIVNAANSGLSMGGGVCGAIFAAAGAKEMKEACRAIGGCPTGGAVITPGFRLKAKYVIHSVGPIWRGGGENEPELLASCYRNSLRLAKENGLKSVAFPLISAGIYGYPKDLARRVAKEAILAFLNESGDDLSVFLVLRGPA